MNKSFKANITKITVIHKILTSEVFLRKFRSYSIWIKNLN